MNAFKPPMNIAKRDPNTKFCFLAGSIEMGKAEDWQEDMETFFLQHHWGTFNPRREDFDAKQKQSYQNPYMYQQINWEYNALEKSDLILVYIQPDTLSPITLMEIGKYSIPGKMFIVSPPGFWRTANLECYCDRYNISLFDDMDDFRAFFMIKYCL